MTDITVVILTCNEHLHLTRCLERLAPLEAAQTVVVDSESTDDTRDIALRFGAKVVVHPWPGNQSEQLNWAIDNLELKTEWILRLDADEYLTKDSIEWLKQNLGTVCENVSALEFTLERKFMGGTIRYGTNGIKMIRAFRNGHGRYHNMLMDERIVHDGDKLSVPVVFYDDNLNPMEWWKEKHRKYAVREAKQALADVSIDRRKASYYKLPPYLRVVMYFVLRYVIRGGFLDGAVGWKWHFWQGLWYRWIIDDEIRRLKAEKTHAPK